MISVRVKTIPVDNIIIIHAFFKIEFCIININVYVYIMFTSLMHLKKCRRYLILFIYLNYFTLNSLKYMIAVHCVYISHNRKLFFSLKLKSSIFFYHLFYITWFYLIIRILLLHTYNLSLNI